MYTFKITSALLTSLGHQLGPAPEGNNKNSTGFDSRFYTFQPLSAETILQDLLDYLTTANNPSAGQRVAFLSTTESGIYFAVLIECLNINKYAVTALNEFVKNNPKLRSSDLLDNKTFLNLLRCIYAQTKATFLSNARAIAGWNQWVQQAYPSTEFIIQPLPNTNATIVFTEFVHRFLEQGEFPLALDITQIYRTHFQSCVTTLTEKLKQLQLAAPENYQLIQTSIQILSKYGVLREKRKQLPLAMDSLEQIELIQAMDQYLKKSIYSETIVIEQFIKHFSLGTIVELLSYVDAQQMLDFLQNEQAQQLKQLLDWQKNLTAKQTQLAQSWKNYLGWKLIQAGRAIYQNSLIGIGAELFKWTSDALMELLVSNRLIMAAKVRIKNTFDTLTKWLTFSPPFADKTAKKVEHLFDVIYKTPVVKGMGVGVGLSLTYLMGPYQLLRIMLVNKIGLRLSQLFKAEELNDESAQVVRRTYLPDSGSYARMTNLLLAAGETAYRSDYRYLVSALGATVGSITTTQLAKKWIADLHVPIGQSMTEGQVLALFFIATAGLEIGQCLVSYGINIFEMLDDCNQAKTAFAKLIHEHEDLYLSATAECSTQPNLASFCLAADSPLYLNWITHKKEFFETNCLIKHNYDQVVCEKPIQVHTLRIN